MPVSADAWLPKQDSPNGEYTNTGNDFSEQPYHQSSEPFPLIKKEHNLNKNKKENSLYKNPVVIMSQLI